MSYCREQPFHASILERSLLSKEGSTRNTWHVVLDLQGSKIRYEPGQSIAVIPENDPEHVAKVMHHFRSYSLSERTCLEEKLTTSLDIMRPSDRLLQKIAPSLIGQSGFDVAWVLERYPCACTIEEFISLLRPLLPRFYSIASSQRVHDDQVHLVVLEVDFMLQGEDRKGVASSYLTCRCPLHKPVCRMYVKEAPHFCLPQALDTPIIMIAAGTGIAPFRSFLQEREHLRAPKKTSWLFFGERNRQLDFFFQDFLEQYRERYDMRLNLAFSRDHAAKEYVIHHMMKEKEELVDWLDRGAHLYVSGSLTRLGKSVGETLLHIGEEKYGNEHAARQWLQALRRDRRYLQDVY